MNAVTSKPRDVPQEINEYLRELYLPAMRRCFEEKARQAERETLGYEHYLLELVAGMPGAPRQSYRAFIAGVQAAAGKDDGQL